MASNPTTPKAVYVSVSVEPCNSEETRKYWAERAARAKAGLANPSALVNRASGEFDQGLVNAILAGKGELIATTVDGVREDNSMSTTDVDGTVVHHDVSGHKINTSSSGLHSAAGDNCKGTEPFPSLQSVSSGSILRSSDPFVDKHTTNTRATSEQSSHRRQETARYHVPMDNNVGSTQPPASTPTASSPDEDDIFVGGEPGPDVGYRYRADSRVSQPSTPTTTAPEDCHDSNNVHPGASRPSFSVCTVSRSGSRPASRNRSRSRRPSAVHQKRSVSSLRSKFSSRKFSTASNDGQDPNERPIVVTNALHHILYDGPCGHCETNHCACQTPDSPGLPPVDAPSNNRTRITTEGFCRHCVLNRCNCVVEDPRWGLHHATDTLRRTQQQQQQRSSTEQRGASSEQQSLRIISDTGTVRHYATGPDGSPSSNSSSGREDQVTTTATITNTNAAAAPRTPPPAYRARFSLARSGGNDQVDDSNNNVHSPAVDIEAQEQQGQPRRRFRLWRIRCQPRSHSRTRSDVRPAPTTRDLTKRFYECLAGTLAAVLIIIGVWYYTNHNNHAAATEQQSPTGPY
ncbi:hypothetical protein PG984_000758 [Apiospora sp. TS-2023a]